MKKIIYSLIFSALMFTSCQKEGVNDSTNNSTRVKISTQIGATDLVSRTNPDSTDPVERTVFNDNDAISLKMDVNTQIYTYYESYKEWVADQGTYLTWDTDQMSYEAFYPTTEGTTITGFNLPLDQSSPEKIAAADYMRKSGTAEKLGDGTIDLAFERQMARVVVQIGSFGTEFEGVPVITDLKINSSASSISGNSAGDNTVAPISPIVVNGTVAGGVGTTYTALVVPANTSTGVDFITIVVNGKSLQIKDIPAFTTGNSYTYTLKVGKDRVEIASQVLVENWTTGAIYNTDPPKIAIPKVGDYVYDDHKYSTRLNPDKTVLGVVFDVYLPSGIAKLVSLQEKAALAWSNNTASTINTTKTTTTSGCENMAFIKDQSADFSGFPAFEWVHNMDNATSYGAGVHLVWYVPIKDELEDLGEKTIRDIVIASIAALPEETVTTTILDGKYWTSTENKSQSNTRANHVEFYSDGTSGEGNVSKTFTDINTIAVMSFTF